MKTEIGFAHRQNGDGTFDSICLHCHLPIARRATEKQLTEAEQTHECSKVIAIAKVTAQNSLMDERQTPAYGRRA